MTVKVRFAPSPTGRLHVGNIRAALVNWLYARKHGGSFLLRLDDTDLERSTKVFADGIEEDLTWLGLDWDERAFQSDRFDRYAGAAQTLRDAGRLYACYETTEELELKRKLLRARGLPPIYDREGLNLTKDERAKLEAEGRQPHWRFKLDLPAAIEWEDGIRGPVSIDLANVSDPILVRHDGSYLYTLPSVVDDMDFAITHVIRGEDHVTNSAVQAQIFAALGGAVPAFAHFSLLTDVSGGGLSKRLGSLAIEALREDGLEPMAILSLLARLGTSLPVEPFTSLAPLAASFSLGQMGRAPAKFDDHELEVLNAKVLHSMAFDDVKGRLPESVDWVLWDAVKANLDRFDDLDEWVAVIHGPVTPAIEDAEFAEAAAELLPGGAYSDETWKAWTEAVKQATGAKGKALFKPLRLALTGRESGPEMRVLLPLIGRDRAKRRLEGETC